VAGNGSGFPTNYGPADLDEILARQMEELRNSDPIFDEDDVDDAPDGTDEDADDDEVDTADAATSDPEDDSDEDADEEEPSDGEDDDSEDPDDSDGESAQDPSEQSETQDDRGTDAGDDGKPGKKKRRGGALNRVLAENAELKQRLAEIEGGQEGLEQRLLQRLKDEQETSTRQQTELAASEAERAAIDKIAGDFRGSEEEIASLIDAVEEKSDPMAAARLKELRRNRNLLDVLTQFVKNSHTRQFVAAYHSSTQDIPGLDQEIVKTGHIPTVFKHLNEAGYQRGRDEGNRELSEQIEKLQADLAARDEELEELRDKLTSASTRAVGKAKREINVAGGKAPSKRSAQPDLDDLYDERGLLKPEALAGLRTGRIRVLGG
jgi:hypothetical protein